MSEILNNSRFELGEKWFWVGLAMGAVNILAGLIYGIALTAEKERRREGVIIIVFSLVWFLLVAYWLGPWLTKSGWLPNYQMIKKPNFVK